MNSDDKLLNHSVMSDELDKLMPNEGPCKSIYMEVYRSMSKICHDYNQNGFGNNWVYPLLFLLGMDELNNHEILGIDHDYKDFIDYSVGVSSDKGPLSSRQLSIMIDNLDRKVTSWVYGKIHDSSFDDSIDDGVDMWDMDTYPDDLMSAIDGLDDLPSGDPDEWLKRFNCYNHVVENGWRNFEHEKYRPDYDDEYSGCMYRRW